MTAITPHDMVLTPLGLRFRGRRFPCTIGKGGITSDKSEGDGATPRGRHEIVGMLYRPDRMQSPAAWAMPIYPRDRWSDASGEASYNQMVQAPYPHSAEWLCRADPMYDLVLITDWNWPDAQAGKGSAIFMHQYRRSGCPTEGCIGLRRDHLRWIAGQITQGSRLIVP
jgi:L,D-peptidoglycan transpeptidase YkuD (ErfK/YbiS/YcfS/YnhG family)